jgi:hypothetical protein
MSDDLDNLLRRAMKTLDDQVPPGYFEDFANRTLARLEDGSMQDEPHDEIAASRSAEALPVAEAKPPEVKPPALEAEAKPPAVEPKEREEDSGLHDIRSLASSQRMRLSRRSSQNLLRDDDELLASASSSWKAVALPEPAKMISLPDVAELPPAAEAKQAPEPKEAKAGKASKAAKAAAAEAAEAAKEGAKATVAAAAPSPATKEAQQSRGAAAVEQPASVTPITAAKPKAAAKAPGSGRRNTLIATAGLGLAAAAGAVIFVSTQSKSDQAASSEAMERSKGAGAAMPELQQIAPTAVPAAPEPAPAAGSAAPADDAAKLKIAEPPATKGKVEPPVEKPGKSIGKLVPNVVEDDPKPTDKKDEGPKKPPEPGDPDFDKLLKEAGYQEKKAEAPKLEKKMLSGDDIKKGMNAINPKVLSCYAGTQGTASVKLTVLPTGQIQKVTVTGQFAGTPVGACVEGAVQMVSFPAWDGPPQSVSYSYLLAE